MKKKNVMTGIISLSLVAVMAVGATLAYLTAKDAPVTNTFAFGGDNGKSAITVELKETTPTATGDEKITGTEDTGFSYTNVVPGQTLNKEPKITANVTVDSYVFIKVTGLSKDVNLGGTTDQTDNQITQNGWTAVGSLDTYGNGTYYKMANFDQTAETAVAQKPISEAKVFSKVTVNADLTKDNGDTFATNKIKIEVAAIQKVGFDDATAALAQIEKENLFTTTNANP